MSEEEGRLTKSFEECTAEEAYSPEQECRSDHGDEELTDVEIELLKKELHSEVSELEWEFKQAKEALFNERIMQVENKLSQARSGTAPEFLHVVALVEETYKIRSQVAKHRMEFAREIANKEVDNELQIAQCSVDEKILQAEEQIRLRLQENLCRLQVEKTALNLKNGNVCANASDVPENPEVSGEKDKSEPNLLSSDKCELYLPSPNLEPRKKPVTLSPKAPRLIYQLPEEDIQADVEAILSAVKKHKLAFAMSELNKPKKVC